MIKESRFSKKLDNNQVQITIYSDTPVLKDGEVDRSGVYLNNNGVLYSQNYGMLILTKTVDSNLFVGLLGNNHRLTFDKYWAISQFSSQSQLEFGRENTNQRISEIGTYKSPDELIKYAKNKSLDIVFSIGEPSSNFDYISDVATEAKDVGVGVSLTTNGSFNIEQFKVLSNDFKRINVLLHSMQPFFYKKHCKYNLESVTSFIEFLVKDYQGEIHIETTIIPGENNTPHDIESFSQFIKRFGNKVQWNIIPFKPTHKILDKKATTEGELINFQTECAKYGVTPILL